MDSFDIIDHYISRLDFMLKDENQRKPDYNEFKVQLKVFYWGEVPGKLPDIQKTARKKMDKK